MINQTNTQRSDAGSLCQIENSNAVFSLLIAWNYCKGLGGEGRGLGSLWKLLWLMRFIITHIGNYFVYLMQLVTENLKGELVMMYTELV